jgi:hypothetical protein
VSANNVVKTRTPSAIGLLLAIVVALLAAGIALFLSVRLLNPSMTHLLPFVVFIAIFSVIAWTFHVRRFIFDEASKTFTVEDCWLLVVRKSAQYNFADIRSISADAGGDGGAKTVIELSSGEKLYSAPGTRRQIVDLTGLGGAPKQSRK